MQIRNLRGAIFAFALLCGHAYAQPVEPGPSLLPANTVVELETVDAVSSRSNKPGDYFHLKVRVDVRGADGAVLIPAGTPAMGQVVHAARSSAGGKGGELILAARYIESAQGQLKLRSNFGVAGKARVGASIATAMVVGPFALLIKGRELELPAATALSARLANDFNFSPP